MSTAASTGGGGGGSTGGAVSTGGSAGGGSTGFSGGGSSGAAVIGWGDDWRTRIAVASSTDSEKEIKRLERFEGPEQIYKSFREMERKMSAGELRTSLPKGASPDETARWRQENGIPAKPEDYKVTMPQGKEAPKEDDAFLSAFRKSALDSNYTQAQFDHAVSTWYSEVDRQLQAITEHEREAEQKTEDALRQEWGADYRPNKAMAEALLARAPAGFRDRFMNGHLADYTPIRASPDAWKWLVQMEREINPASTVVPGAGGDLGKTIDTELTEIKALMANNNSEYWKGPKADGYQKRYRDLLAAQANMNRKAGVAT